MTTPHLAGDHEAIVEPDSRGRFNLRKFFGATPGARYKVIVEDDRSKVTLVKI